MGKPTGFMEFDRHMPEKRDPSIRVKDYKELYKKFKNEELNNQAARCMDCGVPFCHNGCPLGNVIPEFNDATYRNDWEEALEILSSTNNFPEFTGRICPAPCESACVLGINKPPVAIELIEKTIIEKAFAFNLIKPHIPKNRTEKKVAVIGSGPAGLAAAAQLNKAGHWVTVFERADRLGGLLRYGIPDFKLEKSVIDRRIKLMRKEGISFKTSVHVGVDISVEVLSSQYDAIVLCGGATKPRDLPIQGRNLAGIYPAMEFLTQNNKSVAGDNVENQIMATNKNVVVIGGGDTGSDCVGTSNRHGALSVTQIELLAKPLNHRTDKDPWPLWPMTLKTSTSHEEGADRNWSINTKEFIGDERGNVTGLKIVDIEWIYESGKRPSFKEKKGTERIIPCDLALLAIGFLHGETNHLQEQLGIELDGRGNISTKNYQTSNSKVFAAGDMRRGQSLVVWAISEGREAARSVDIYLMGESSLESKDKSFTNVKATSFI